MDAREAGERATGRLDTGDILAEIELCHLVSFAISCICHIHRYRNRASITYPRWLHREMVVAERGVAKTEAKRKERLAIVVHVFVNAGRVAVVEIRKLADAARKGDGESPCGIVVSEERFSDGLAAKLARVPSFKDGRNVLLGPANGERPAIFKHEDYRLPGGDNGLQKLLLIAREIETRAVEAFARNALPLAKPEDDSVRLLRCGDSGCNVLARIEGDSCVGDDRANAIEQADALAIRFALIVAIAPDVCIRSDDRDVAKRFRKRQ